jgi:hypothetical protein
MAAAIAQRPAASPGLPSNPNMAASASEERLHSKQFEKEKIAHFSDTQRTLSPQEIEQSAKDKEIGGTSNSLSVNDFDLVRTLGTGLSCLSPSTNDSG